MLVLICWLMSVLILSNIAVTYAQLQSRSYKIRTLENHIEQMQHSYLFLAKQAERLEREKKEALEEIDRLKFNELKNKAIE